MTLEEASSCKYLLRLTHNTEHAANAIINKIFHLFSDVDQFKTIASNYKWITDLDTEHINWVKQEVARYITMYIDTYYIKPLTEYTITCTKTHMIIIHIELLVINLYTDGENTIIESAIHEERRKSSATKK